MSGFQAARKKKEDDEPKLGRVLAHDGGDWNRQERSEPQAGGEQGGKMHKDGSVVSSGATGKPH